MYAVYWTFKGLIFPTRFGSAVSRVLTVISDSFVELVNIKNLQVRKYCD